MELDTSGNIDLDRVAVDIDLPHVLASLARDKAEVDLKVLRRCFLVFCLHLQNYSQTSCIFTFGEDKTQNRKVDTPLYFHAASFYAVASLCVHLICLYVCRCEPMR